jgi:hypothetical protein
MLRNDLAPWHASCATSKPDNCAVKSFLTRKPEHGAEHTQRSTTKAPLICMSPPCRTRDFSDDRLHLRVTAVSHPGYPARPPSSAWQRRVAPGISCTTAFICMSPPCRTRDFSDDRLHLRVTAVPHPGYPARPPSSAWQRSLLQWHRCGNVTATRASSTVVQSLASFP